VQCQLPDCRGKDSPPIVTNRPHKINVDGYSINFCSNDHARVGLTRWEEKKKLGVKPGQPFIKEDEGEYVGDNIQELEEKE
jgi:hypothetical protein